MLSFVLHLKSTFVLSSSSCCVPFLGVKPRCRRTVFTNAQKLALDKLFQEDSWPDYYKRKRIARELGLSMTVVNNRYKNKRAKYRMKKIRD